MNDALNSHAAVDQTQDPASDASSFGESSTRDTMLNKPFDIREKQFTRPWTDELSCYESMPDGPVKDHMLKFHATLMGTIEVANLLAANGNAVEIAASYGDSPVPVGFDAGNLKCAYHILVDRLHSLEERMREDSDFWRDARVWLNKWDGK